MFLSRVAQSQVPLLCLRASGHHFRVSGNAPKASAEARLLLFVRNYANEAREGFARKAVRRRTLKEMAQAPAGETAFNLGKGVAASAAAVGLGSLCYYGLGLSNQPGAIDRAVLWPEYVRDRIRSTYFYFGGSVALTAASAAAFFRSPVMMNLLTRSGWLAIGATFAAMIGSGMLVRSLPYKEGFGSKQLAWAAHCAVMGAVIAPLCFMGGPVLMRAAWYTAGIVGGLSAVSACAPSEQFLHIGGPLAVGLGVVFASSIGSMFLPATTALGAGLYSVSLYGGLVVFSGFLLYDTQRLIKAAEAYPVNGVRPFDPINMSISIYLDTINIFVRIASILAGGGGNRRK